MRATIGRVVHVEFLNDQPDCNGSRIHPAIVTAAHGGPNAEQGPEYINVKVLTDGPQPALWLTSVPRKDSVSVVGEGYPAVVWFWPPREDAQPQVTERPAVASTVDQPQGTAPTVSAASTAATVKDAKAPKDRKTKRHETTDGSAAGEKSAG